MMAIARKLRNGGLALSLMLLSACSANVDVGKLRSTFGDFDVVLLSTSTCGYCKKLRADLADWGVDYIDVDIESERKGRDAFVELNGRGVPVLMIGDQAIHGYSPERSHELLAAANLLSETSKP